MNIRVPVSYKNSICYIQCTIYPTFNIHHFLDCRTVTNLISVLKLTHKIYWPRYYRTVTWVSCVNVTHDFWLVTYCSVNSVTMVRNTTFNPNASLEQKSYFTINVTNYFTINSFGWRMSLNNLTTFKRRFGQKLRLKLKQVLWNGPLMCVEL